MVQSWPTRTAVNKEFWHQEVCNNQPCPSLTLPLKVLCWNLSGSSVSWGGSPYMALQCTSPSSQLWCFRLFGLTVLQAHKLVFGNKWRHKRRWKQPSLVWILWSGESQPIHLSHVCRLTPISSKMIEQDRGNRGRVGREISADEGPAENSKE